MSISINVTDTVMGQDLEIPTIPEVFARISSMAQDPDVGIPEIGQVVAQDPPLAAKVLQIVNSATYGLRENVVSCEHATSVLGIRVLRNVVLQASVMGDFSHLQSLYDLTKLWKHSILSAQVAAVISSSTRAELPIAMDEIYTCGLLHNIGTMVLLNCAKETYADLLNQGNGSEEKLWQLEEETLGFTHCEEGAMVARRWGLPPPHRRCRPPSSRSEKVPIGARCTCAPHPAGSKHCPPSQP
ncbi:MAG: HD-like signal output (HDOD) protein [Planctomycetota bacterium]|jgi:HD-like signal output (HDOD) protein